MLLPPLLKTLLFFGGLALAGVSVIAISVQRSRAKRIPGAAVVGARAARKRSRHRGGQLAGVLVGLGLSYVMYFRTVEVIVVDGDGDNLEATRRYSLSVPDTSLSPDASEPQGDREVWVVNRSTRTVRVNLVRDSVSDPFPHAGETRIPPGTAASFNSIDDIGRAGLPTGIVRNTVKRGPAWRNWLTW